MLGWRGELRAGAGLCAHGWTPPAGPASPHIPFNQGSPRVCVTPCQTKPCSWFPALPQLLVQPEPSQHLLPWWVTTDGLSQPGEVSQGQQSFGMGSSPCGSPCGLAVAQGAAEEASGAGAGVHSQGEGRHSLILSKPKGESSVRATGARSRVAVELPAGPG